MAALPAAAWPGLHTSSVLMHARACVCMQKTSILGSLSDAAWLCSSGHMPHRPPCLTELSQLEVACWQQQSGSHHAVQEEQQYQVLPHVACAVADALHATQIPVQDLLGFLSFAPPLKHGSSGTACPAYTQVLSRLVLESFIDADGVLP